MSKTKYRLRMGFQPSMAELRVGNGFKTRFGELMRQRTYYAKKRLRNKTSPP